MIPHRIILLLTILVTILHPLSAQTPPPRLDQLAPAGPQDFQFLVPAGPGAPERFVFTIAVRDGDPVFQFLDPAGTVLPAGDPRVEFLRFNGAVLAAVIRPSPGKWTLRILGSLGPDSFSVQAKTRLDKPEVYLDGVTLDGTTARLIGHLEPNIPGLAISASLSREKGTFEGLPQQTGKIDAQGRFDLNINTEVLPNGTWYGGVAVEVGPGLPAVIGFFDQPLKLDRPLPLKPAANVSAYSDTPTSIAVSFDDTNNGLAKGYTLWYREATSDKELSVVLGPLVRGTIPGLTAGKSYYLRVQMLSEV